MYDIVTNHQNVKDYLERKFIFITKITHTDATYMLLEALAMFGDCEPEDLGVQNRETGEYIDYETFLNNNN